jgi:hypothetical protein
LRDQLAPRVDAIERAIADLEQQHREYAVPEAGYLHRRTMLRTDRDYLMHSDVASASTQEIYKFRESKPGLVDNALRQLRAEYEQWKHRATTDPDVKGKYRFVGRFANYTHPDGHRVIPGEVGELTNRQAESWRDLFEPVAS